MSSAIIASGMLNLASVIVCVFSYASAISLKQRIMNSCTCAPNKQNINVDCNMDSTAKIGYFTSLVSMVLSVLGLVSVLVIFGTNKTQH